jgi:hypothetical protein
MVASPTSTTRHHPACTTTLRVQQRTLRSFVTTRPPDYLASWLLGTGFRVVATRHAHEYGRFGLGGAFCILYWDGSAVLGGDAWRATAQRLVTICEDAPPHACLFDLLDECEVRP